VDLLFPFKPPGVLIQEGKGIARNWIHVYVSNYRPRFYNYGSGVQDRLKVYPHLISLSCFSGNVRESNPVSVNDVTPDSIHLRRAVA